MDAYPRAAQYAGRIEQELRALGVWRTEPMPPEAFESERAFFADTMTFYQWLQFVLIERIREIVETEGSFPKQSQVGVYAVRELDGCYEAGALIGVLSDFDEFIESVKVGSSRAGSTKKRKRPPKRLQAEAETVPAPVAEPEGEPEHPDDGFLRERAAAYWQKPAAELETRASRPSLDVSLAERVLETARGCVEMLEEVEWQSGGPVVRAVVEADRGAWVVCTALRREDGVWRMDRRQTLEATTLFYLRQHQVHAPYAEEESARGRAMEFWAQASRRQERWARELLTPETREAALPAVGDGQTDEFFWYLGHREEPDGVEVRVLMNTHTEQRTLRTWMVDRAGAWFVDLAETRRRS